MLWRKGKYQYYVSKIPFTDEPKLTRQSGTHCSPPRFKATFYIQFWTTSEKTPKTATFIPNWWIHPCILAVHRLRRASRQHARSREPAHQTLTQFAAGTSKDWELPCEPVLPLPARASSNCCSSPCTWVPTPRLAPVSLNLQPEVQLDWQLMDFANSCKWCQPAPWLVVGFSFGVWQEFQSQRCLTPDLVSSIGEIKRCTTNTSFGLMICAQMGVCVCNLIC